MNAEREIEASFEALFADHWDRVYPVLYRCVGDRAEAEDLAIEVFWQLFRRPPTGGTGANLRGWLYRVAIRMGYNALRAEKRRRRYEREAGVAYLGRADLGDPAEEAERNMARQRVRRVLAQMKPRQAQVLLLRHSGLSYAEVAEALAVAPGSVGTMLARAERAFERHYRALEGGDGNASD